MPDHGKSEQRVSTSDAIEALFEGKPLLKLMWGFFFREGKAVKDGWFAVSVMIILSAIGGCEWKENHTQSENDRQALQLAIGAISGTKRNLRDLLILHRNEEIHTAYYYTLWELSGKPETSKEYSNMREHWAKSDDIKKDIGTAEKDFFQNVTTIEILCPKDKEVKKTAVALQHATELLPLPEREKDAQKLETWKYTVFHSKEAFVDDQFTRHVDEFLNAAMDNFQKR